MDKGKTLNPTFVDYKTPLSTDVPNMKLIDIVTNDPDDPFGAKEAFEDSIVSTPLAVASAIDDATGVWFKELPITPEKAVTALREKMVKTYKAPILRRNILTSWGDNILFFSMWANSENT